MKYEQPMEPNVYENLLPEILASSVEEKACNFVEIYAGPEYLKSNKASFENKIFENALKTNSHLIRPDYGSQTSLAMDQETIEKTKSSYKELLKQPSKRH